MNGYFKSINNPMNFYEVPENNTSPHSHQPCIQVLLHCSLSSTVLCVLQDPCMGSLDPVVRDGD